MQKEIYFFDEIENRLVSEAYQYIMGALYYDVVDPLTESKSDGFVKSKLYAAMHNYFYDDISIQPNNFIHKYLSTSLIQSKTYLPSARAKIIQDAIWAHLWGQFEPDHEITLKELEVINTLIGSYDKHFPLYVELLNTLNTDFKAGLLGTPAPQIILTPDKPEALPIKYEAYNLFLKQFEYNYPYKTTALSFKYDTKTYLDYLKTEILENIITLNQDSRKPYLNRLKNELHNNKQYANTTQDTINQWLEKYNIESEEEIKLGRKNNELFSILTADVPPFDDEYDENFNKDTRNIQTDFYSFYYGFYLDAAIDFINDQIKEHSPTPLAPTAMKQLPPLPLPPKLKTNLTVPQLSYLFKMLMDIKPPIFDIKSNKELYQFIEANFTTKGKVDAGPTVAKLNNLYSDVDKSTGIFWAEKLNKMLQDARKI
ncbi:MAG: hypothetical protein H7Z76_04700 [Methylotenera sp.]|nr:hypothetical protein [Flavobacterium sp.]